MNNLTPTQAQIKEKLAQELNISHLSPEEQGEIITQMSTVLLDRITIAMVAELPMSQMARIDSLLEAGQTEAVQALLLKNVPSASEIADRVILETVGEYHALISNKAQE